MPLAPLCKKKAAHVGDAGDSPHTHTGRFVFVHNNPLYKSVDSHLIGLQMTIGEQFSIVGLLGFSFIAHQSISVF